MCGIIGIVGKESIIKALKSLEYRGYDSWGIAYLDNGELHVVKKVGSISDVDLNIHSEIKIGHTRWATHGKVNEINAHPHMDCKKRIALVHNGVIENVKAIKSMLSEHDIISDTDSELIAHLLETYKQKDLFNILKGSFAVVYIKKGEHKIYFLKHFSPLYIVKLPDGYALTSDVSSFDYEFFIPLNDGDYGYISKTNYVIMNGNKQVTRERFTTNISRADQGKKDGYYMLKEIYDQKDIIDNSLSHSLTLDFTKRIDVVAAGSSYNAAYIGNLLAEQYLDKHMNVYFASEYKYIRKHISAPTTVVAVSQSGETADTLSAVRFAKDRGAYIVGITNYVGSSLTYLSDEYIIMNAGVEKGVAATKTFTAQLGVFYKMLLKDIDRNEIKKALSKEYDMKYIARQIFKFNKFFFLGKGLLYGVAREGSLKFKELTYNMAEAYPSGELKHGPLSIIDDKTAVISLIYDNDTFSKSLSSLEEVKSRGAYTVVLSNKHIEDVDQLISIPNIKAPYHVFAYLIPLQLLAFNISLLLGYNPDKPRNLAKSVTVE